MIDQIFLKRNCAAGFLILPKKNALVEDNPSLGGKRPIIKGKCVFDREFCGVVTKALFPSERRGISVGRLYF
jgi:hypothetical protein